MAIRRRLKRRPRSTMKGARKIERILQNFASRCLDSAEDRIAVAKGLVRKLVPRKKKNCACHK